MISKLSSILVILITLSIKANSQSNQSNLSANWGYEGLNNKQMLHEYNGFFIDITYKRKFLQYFNVPLGISLSRGIREDNVGRFFTRYDNIYIFSGLGSEVELHKKHKLSLSLLTSAGLMFLDYTVPNEDSFTANGVESTYEAGMYYGLGGNISYSYYLTDYLSLNIGFHQHYFTSNLGNNNFFNSHGFLADKLHFSRISFGFSVEF